MDGLKRINGKPLNVALRKLEWWLYEDFDGSPDAGDQCPLYRKVWAKASEIADELDARDEMECLR